MALVFMDSFERYSTNDIVDKYETLHGSPSIGGTAYYGSQGLAGSNTNVGVTKFIGGTQSTIIVGVAWRPFVPGGSPRILSLWEGSTLHADIRLNSTRTLSMERNGTALQTSGQMVNDFQWYWVEWKCVIADSGSWTLKLDGVTWLSGTGDTRNGGSGYCNSVRLHGIDDQGVTWNMDNLYILDGSGAAPLNDLIGEARVECLYPNGNGNSSDFVGSDSDSIDNYLLVDEADPDDNTTYVQSLTPGAKDTYAFTNLAATAGDVYAVQINPNIAKTDVGARTFATVARESGGTEADGTTIAPTTTYKYYPSVRPTKPSGGAWSISDVNGAEFGIKVVS